MKKDKNSIDDFFRDNLKNLEITPSPGARDALLKEAERKGYRNIRQWYWILPVLMVVGITGWLLLSKTLTEVGPSPLQTTEKKPQGTSPASAPVDQAKQEPITLTPSGSIPAKASSDLGTPHNQKPLHTALSSTSSSSSTSSGSGILPLADENPPDEHQPKLQDETTQLTKADPIGLTLSPASGPSPDSVSQETLPLLADEPESDTIITPTAPAPAGKATEPRLPREWRLSTGLQYSPEWMFETLEGTKPVTSFGIEGSFRFGPYSVRSGIGLSISKGTNQLAIEYNDYLGSYMHLDSMTFAWNLQHTDLIPTYYLTKREVYDSLMKLENAKVVKRFTYLQVPLILGYDFWEAGNFSMGVRMGPVMSVLLGSRTLSDPYDPGKKLIVSINQITPEQISLNWQLVAGLNISYRFARRFGMEVEPFGKYYLNSVYEAGGNGVKPWALGIRAALFISF